MSEIVLAFRCIGGSRCGMLEVRLKMDENLAKNVAEDEETVDVLRILARDPLQILIAPEPKDAKARDLWNTERKKVRAYLDQLLERERFVILSQYGVDGPVKTLEEIAEQLGVSRERVRQIEKRAVIRFRQKWGRRFGCEFGTARRRFLLETMNMVREEIHKDEQQPE